MMTDGPDDFGLIDLIGREVDDYWHGVGENSDALVFRDKYRDKWLLKLHDVDFEKLGDS